MSNVLRLIFRTAMNTHKPVGGDGGDGAKVSCTVKNTGSVAGAEVTLELDADAFKYFDADKHCWILPQP